MMENRKIQQKNSVITINVSDPEGSFVAPHNFDLIKIKNVHYAAAAPATYIFFTDVDWTQPFFIFAGSGNLIPPKKYGIYIVPGKKYYQGETIRYRITDATLETATGLAGNLVIHAEFLSTL